MKEFTINPPTLTKSSTLIKQLSRNLSNSQTLSKIQSTTTIKPIAIKTNQIQLTEELLRLNMVQIGLTLELKKVNKFTVSQNSEFSKIQPTTKFNQRWISDNTDILADTPGNIIDKSNKFHAYRPSFYNTRRRHIYSHISNINTNKSVQKREKAVNNNKYNHPDNKYDYWLNFYSEILHLLRFKAQLLKINIICLLLLIINIICLLLMLSLCICLLICVTLVKIRILALKECCYEKNITYKK